MSRDWQVSFPERNLDPPAMPSQRTSQDDLEDYAALFEADVKDAASRLGWQMVERIVEQAKAEEC